VVGGAGDDDVGGGVGVLWNTLDLTFYFFLLSIFLLILYFFFFFSFIFL